MGYGLVGLGGNKGETLGAQRCAARGSNGHGCDGENFNRAGGEGGVASWRAFDSISKDTFKIALFDATHPCIPSSKAFKPWPLPDTSTLTL